jgi:hypothetical protein
MTMKKTRRRMVVAKFVTEGGVVKILHVLAG